MNSLRRLPARAVQYKICAQCRQSNRALSIFTANHESTSPRPPRPSRPFLSKYIRTYASHTPADSIIASLEDQYGTARDEFEIAAEETEKQTVYAAADREAAREELDKMKEMYEAALKGSDGEEVKRRVGHRLRELENAVKAMEKAAQEG